MQSQLSVQKKQIKTKPLNKDISETYSFKKKLSLSNNNDVNSAGKVIKLKVSDIKFSQSTVSDRFRDGTPLQDVIDQLIAQNISPEKIEPVRVVKFRGNWTTLDNRRLRVFKNALVTEVPVIVCDLQDHEIFREFHDKRSNKSIEDGGEIKHSLATNITEHGRSIINRNDNHFDEGTFIFTKKVLNWTFEQIASPLAALKHTPSLPEIYDATHRDEYYRSFLGLILEEARATLQAGIEAAISTEAMPLKWLDAKPSKNPQNPSIFFFQKLISKLNNMPLKPGDMLLLEERASSIKLLAMVGAPKDNMPQYEEKIQVKVVIEEFLSRNRPAASNQAEMWFAKPIGSLITHMRMYDACIQMPKVIFESQLLTGKINSIDFNNPYNFFQKINLLEKIVDETPKYGHLNNSQCQAIKKFLQLEQGIELVQGPPGTGKTTMIVALLKELAYSNKRILLCAPSNKAVQILAERFVNEFPDIPVALAGVEDKLPDEPKLQAIFIHTWADRVKQQLACIEQDLWKLLPPENRKPLPQLTQISILNTIKANFLQIYNTVARYRFTFLAKFINAKENFENTIEEHIKLLKKEALDFRDNDLFKQIRILLSTLCTILSKLQNELQKSALDHSKQGLEAQLLDHSCIIFATLSVSGRKTFKEMDFVDALIIDEAGQGVEAETIIPFITRPKKIMLIGDTKQLPATVLSKEAESRNFNRSMLHRLLEKCKHPYTLLNTQYRMHPSISAWPSLQYYEGQVKDAESVVNKDRIPSSLKNAPPFIAPYAFIDVHGQEKTKAGHSFFNENEAILLEQMLHYLNKKHHIDIIKQVGVITFYKGQVDYLQNLLGKKYPDLKIQTVDSFQGGESEIIFISFVRANNKGQVGFLNDFRRLNVALTRAKHSLVMLGNTKTLSDGNEDLAGLIKDASNRGCLFDVQQVQQKIFIRNNNKSSSHESNYEDSLKRQPYSTANTPVCRFFTGAVNSCRKGEQCEFSHQAPAISQNLNNNNQI